VTVELSPTATEDPVLTIFAGMAPGDYIAPTD
jgi:hypothetical protein